MPSSVDWQAYAQVYDLMAEHNPAYQELLQLFVARARCWRPAPGAALVDLGAGTGNFSLELARLHPGCRVIHVDSNGEMSRVARRKAEARCLGNVQFEIRAVSALSFPPKSLQAVVCVHALYVFPAPFDLIRNVFGWLKPGGLFFACDPGRPMDVRDWSKYLLGESYRRQGWRKTVTLFWRTRAVAKQNRRIAAAQQTGRCWLHSLAEFQGAFQSAGFTIEHAQTVYRGCSDLVVCRKTTPS